MSPGMDDLAKEYEKSIPEKIKQIEELVLSLQKEIKPDLLSSLQGLVHKIAGTAGSFGFASASTFCKEWDQKLKQKKEELAQGKDISSFSGELSSFLQKLKEVLSKKG